MKRLREPLAPAVLARMTDEELLARETDIVNKAKASAKANGMMYIGPEPGDRVAFWRETGLEPTPANVIGRIRGEL
jgi:hypothetical protein